jgi:hypothetical protein
LSRWSLAVDANNDAEVYGLDMLGEELVQSHLELEGDLIDDDTHQKVPIFPCSAVVHPAFP